MTPIEKAQQLKARYPDLLAEPVAELGEVSLVVLDAAHIREICAAARQELGFAMLLDLASVDRVGEDPRWVVVYELYSVAERCHLRLKALVSEERSELPSVASVWPGADWLEREIYDMMGIRFSGHPDLRRILMWEGYPYYPLRKDFPLAGKPTELPGVAFARPAPLEGGPFVTAPSTAASPEREPRAKTFGS